MNRELTSIYHAASADDISGPEFRLYTVLVRQIGEGKLILPSVVTSRSLIAMQATGAHSSAHRNLMSLHDKGYISVQNISTSSRPIFQLTGITYFDGK